MAKTQPSTLGNPQSNAQMAQSFPALLRVNGRTKGIEALLTEAIAAGMPITLAPTSFADDGGSGTFDDTTAVDPSLATEAPSMLRPTRLPPPLPGTSYPGLTPTQRHAFITWSRQPHEPAPHAFQQLYLANLEACLLEADFQPTVFEKLIELGDTPAWANNFALHRTYLLACWLARDGQRLAEWISGHALPAELLGIAFGMQGILGTPMSPPELGNAIATWQLGTRLPPDLLKLRLDSLASILGQPPLEYTLAQLDPSDLAPRPWRSAHRGLRLLIPQPEVRPILEPALRDLLAVADVNEEDRAPISNLASSYSSADDAEATPPADQKEQPSLEDLGWRLILEFGSNRSEYFDYVLVQAQKLASYSQLMDEDRRIVYRIIFRKSEMRRFWRIWDYVHGWTSTRVYLNGDELEKWKVWPYSQYLK